MSSRTPRNGTLKPLYNFMKDLPSIGGTPIPFLPHRFVKRTAGTNTSFDAGRGCPFQCSFCTIINVQGRKSRFRSADDIEKVVRDNWAQGISRFFITDDNFARNKEWEALYDRLAKLREVDKIPLGLMIQVDTMCHKIPNFIEKSKRAGVTRVFIGLENVNPDNLIVAKKKQNKITEYRKMLLAWKAQGILPTLAIFSGSPTTRRQRSGATSPSSSASSPLDILEFNILTPLPGSEDQSAVGQGIGMDPDLNKYDLEHAVTDHPKMTRQEFESIYQEAWSLYYSPRAHRDVVATGGLSPICRCMSVLKMIMQFTITVQVEKMHPLQGGLIRLKHIDERRPELPAEITA